MSKCRQLLARHEDTIIHSIIMAALYSLPIVLSLKMTSSIFSYDSWWHLRSAQWIIENGTVPFTDPFSINEGVHWIAYSWLYELLLYGLYDKLGLVGWVVYVLVMSVLITFTLYSIMQTLLKNFSVSAALSMMGIFAIGGSLLNRSLLFSILFYSITLLIIFRAKSRSNMRLLLFLPPLFIIWANFHIQFVYGLFAYGIIALDEIYGYYTSGGVNELKKNKQHVWWLAGIGIACFLSTLVTPYHVYIYAHLFEILKQGSVYTYITELHAMNFRTIDDWATLTVILATFFFIGWQRFSRPFPLILLTTACIMSFRSSRDAWFIVITGLTFIAASKPAGIKPPKQPHQNKFFVGIGIAVIFLFFWNYYNLSNEMLQNRLKDKFPVKAAEFIENQGYSDPLYNDFDWGGYLMWRLPQLSVSIDGRGYLYGEKALERSVQTWMAKPGWEEDQQLISAYTVIANSKLPLSSALKSDSRFDLVYEDEVALVFVAADSHQQ
jgi:hypothetical protein